MALDLKTPLPKKTSSLVALIVLGLVLAGVVGFSVGKFSYPESSQTSSKTPPLLAVKGAELLQTQTASLVGKIIKIEGDNLFIQDSSGKVSDFPVIPTVLVSKPVGGKLVASQSGGLQNLELNQDVLVNLVAKNGEYIITAITYLPAVPAFTDSPASSPAKNR